MAFNPVTIGGVWHEQLQQQRLARAEARVVELDAALAAARQKIQELREDNRLLTEARVVALRMRRGMREERDAATQARDAAVRERDQRTAAMARMHRALTKLNQHHTSEHHDGDPQMPIDAEVADGFVAYRFPDGRLAFDAAALPAEGTKQEPWRRG